MQSVLVLFFDFFQFFRFSFPNERRENFVERLKDKKAIKFIYYRIYYIRKISFIFDRQFALGQGQISAIISLLKVMEIN